MGNACSSWSGVVESSGILYVLLTMWMVFPNQAAGLQGLLCVNRDFLAVNDLGIGSGWQQSRQNWMPAAVVGQRIRMESRGLCNVEAAPLHSVLCFFCPVLVPALLLHSRGSLVTILSAWHCDVFMTWKYPLASGTYWLFSQPLRSSALPDGQCL